VERAPQARRGVPAPKTRVPSIPADLVGRRRLLDSLWWDSAPDGRVALVTGAAGAGKTTLVAQWLEQRRSEQELAVAWVSLNPQDDEVHALWSAVLVALEQCGAWSDTPPLHDLEAPRRSVGQGFLAQLVDAIESAAVPVCLVLDDLHVLRDRAALDSIDALLRSLPKRFELVLSARFTPDLAVARLQVEGRLVRVTAPDLAFTREEVGALLHRHGLQVCPEDLTALHRRTEGWAAGLALAVSSMGRRADVHRFIEEFAGDDRTMADYLVGEVLRQLEPDVVDFLLAASICDDVDHDLAVAVTGRPDAARLLDEVEHANVLVTRAAGHDTTYRYHAMLREYLQAELARRDPGLVPVLHRRAAGRLAARGEPLRALEHAVAAADPGLVRDVVAREGLRLVWTGSASRVRRALARARRAGLVDPVLGLVEAVAALDAGDTAALADVEHTLAVLPPSAVADPAWALMATLVRARIALWNGEVAAAVELVGEVDRPLDPDLRLYADGVRAAVRLSSGDQDAEELLTDVVARARAMGRRGQVVSGLAQLTVAAGARADTVEVVARAREVLDHADRLGLGGGPHGATAHVALGWAGYLRADDEMAATGLAEAVALIDAGVCEPATELAARTLAAVLDADAAPAVAADRLRAAWGTDRPLAAWRALAAIVPQTELRLALGLGRRVAAERIVSATAARLGEGAETVLLRAAQALDRGRPDVAERHVRPVLAGSLPAVNGVTSVSAHLLGATAWERQGGRVRAHRALVDALAEAEPLGLARPFLDSGPEVLALLDDGIGRFGRHEAFVALLRSRRVAHEAPGPQNLTARELELLAELPTLGTNEEIAAALVVSVNTVKTHLRSIYRKLGVSTRREAMLAARRRGLV